MPFIVRLRAVALTLAEPNGYTLMLASNQIIINSVFGPVPPFDALNAFAQALWLGVSK